MDGGGDDTPDIKDESHVNVHNSTDNDAPSTDTLKPRGVCGMYAGLFLVSFSVMLNYFVSGTYQAYDTSTWQEHSLLSTINVVRGVIAAVALPVVAKLSDIIGRFECFILISIFFVLGNIIQAAASTIQAFAVGSLFSQIGYTRIQLVGEVIVADTTTLRTRLFFLFFSTFPNLITVSVSGNVTSSVLQATTWRWGYGMWAIIYPVTAIPLVVFFVVQGRRVKDEVTRTRRKSPGQATAGVVLGLPSKLDLFGLFLLTATLSLLLIPLTLAGGETEKWKTPGIITPVVLGALCLPAFLFWETKATHPILPYILFRDRSVWAAIGIAFFGSVTYTAQSEFLYTVLYVCYDFSINAATHVSVLSLFMLAAGGILDGAFIYVFRRAKPLILAGCAV